MADLYEEHDNVDVSQDGMILPLIDFERFLNGSDEEKLAVGQAMAEAFGQTGFIYLKNHGIPKETIDEVFSESARFFARPQEEKDALGWYSPEANRGYVVQGREKATQLTDKTAVTSLRSIQPDLKESLEIGRDDDPKYPNMWPSADYHFRSTMTNFFNICNSLHLSVLSAIALGISLNENFFTPYCRRQANNLRLLHYPPAPANVFSAGQVRAGNHTDYGTITLLFQDSSGGLQVNSPGGTWVPVTPIPETIVVNAGDLLAMWSNDTIKSTEHRVVQPETELPEGGEWPSRYSVVYFCNPDPDAWIEALPGTCDEMGGGKLVGVKAGDYLKSRLDTTYF